MANEKVKTVGSSSKLPIGTRRGRYWLGAFRAILDGILTGASDGEPFESGELSLHRLLEPRKAGRHTAAERLRVRVVVKTSAANRH